MRGEAPAVGIPGIGSGGAKELPGKPGMGGAGIPPRGAGPLGTGLGMLRKGAPGAAGTPESKGMGRGGNGAAPGLARATVLRPGLPPSAGPGCCCPAPPLPGFNGCMTCCPCRPRYLLKTLGCRAGFSALSLPRSSSSVSEKEPRPSYASAIQQAASCPLVLRARRSASPSAHFQ